MSKNLRSNDKILNLVKSTIIAEFKNFKWDILGVVEESGNIFPMTPDTKVLSKVFEMKAIPYMKKIAEKLSTKQNKCKIILAKEQNEYPDITITEGVLDNTKIALDIKSAYRVGGNKFSGFTLGAFNGYFKNRRTTKNITFSYEEYSEHWILCFIYSRDRDTDITKSYSTKDKKDIPKIITNVSVILQDKWKVAKTTPGSGNTANIGGIDNLEKLRKGEGSFESRGELVFDDYWMHYIRKEDCNKIGLSKQPYNDLKTYDGWVKNGRNGEEEIENYYKTHTDEVSSESDKQQLS